MNEYLALDIGIVGPGQRSSEQEVSFCANASAALASGHDLIRGLIGPGVDASHSLERTHIDSVHHTARLLHLYLMTSSPAYLTQYESRNGKK